MQYLTIIMRSYLSLSVSVSTEFVGCLIHCMQVFTCVRLRRCVEEESPIARSHTQPYTVTHSDSHTHIHTHTHAGSKKLNYRCAVKF